MKHETVLLQEPPAGEIKSDLGKWRNAGAVLGRTFAESRPRARKRKSAPDRRRRVRTLVARAAENPAGENARWVIENFRLIYSTEKESREFFGPISGFFLEGGRPQTLLSFSRTDRNGRSTVIQDPA